MNRYRGDIEGLEALIAGLGYVGEWSDLANGKQFRCEDGAFLNWFTQTGTMQYQGPAPQRGQFQEIVNRALSESSATGASTASRPATSKSPVSRLPVPEPVAAIESGDQERVFVVHGHDSVAREQLQLVLHELGLNPIVLANTGGGGLTIIEALENEFGPDGTRIRFGIVLMTPDDMGYGKNEGADRVEPRARQNVVLEMGMLISAIRRPNVAILKKGHIEVPSDAQGIIYIPFNNHVRETVPRLVQRLQEAGFVLDQENITRASIG